MQRSDQGPTRYILEISDQDGYNPQPLLTSFDPIMSPAWSPDGRKIAYVSFENRRSSIYIQDVISGNRQLVSSVTGINGAPAWSADGKKTGISVIKKRVHQIFTH